MTKVLIAGFTAEATDLQHSTLNVDQLRDLIAAGDAEVSEAGYEVVRGWIDSDHDAGVARVRHLLSTTTFDIVLIGGGVREDTGVTNLFERLINAVHELAPHTRFAFNSDPSDTLAALRRNTTPVSE